MTTRETDRYAVQYDHGRLRWRIWDHQAGQWTDTLVPTQAMLDGAVIAAEMSDRDRGETPRRSYLDPGRMRATIQYARSLTMHVSVLAVALSGRHLERARRCVAAIERDSRELTRLLDSAVQTPAEGVERIRGRHGVRRSGGRGVEAG